MARQTTVDEYIDKKTGEINPSPEINKIIHVETRRPDGSIRVQWDYKNCPTMAEQHTAHLTDINYLMSKYKPDELSAYIAARNQYRQEIVGHDFTKEPDLQGAKNTVYRLKKAFEELPEDVKKHFSNHVEFLKFIDNPKNQEKMIALGLMTKKQIQANSTDEQLKQTTANPPENKNQVEAKK